MLKAAGAKRALLLPVSAPFHSSLMKPAAERLQAALEKVTLHAPAIPVVNNVDVATPADAAAIRDALVRQAAGPVRWVEVVAGAAGARHRRTSSNAARARCWPAWSSASTPTLVAGADLRPGHRWPKSKGLLA